MGCLSYPTLRECWLEGLTYYGRQHERRGKTELGQPKVKVNNLYESEPWTHCLKGVREEPSFHPLNVQIRAIVDRKRKIFSSLLPRKSLIKQHNRCHPSILIRR
jgi:hypothetical protein